VKYENFKRKRSWSKADDPPQTIFKPGLTKNKVLLSVWWDWKVIVHYELLQSGETTNSVLYCATHIFDDSEQIDGTWMGSFDASDLAPSDYHLFRALQNSLDGKKLADRDAAEIHLGKLFNNKPQKFYTDGIMKLPEKWQKEIDNNGQYVLD